MLEKIDFKNIYYYLILYIMSKQEQTNHKVSKYKNIRNVTCYLNSILHVLQQTPIFTDLIISGKFSDYLNFERIENNIKPMKLISYQLYQLLHISLKHENASITPTSFWETLGEKDKMWNEIKQQDAQEVFNFIISNIEYEMGKKIKFVYNSITKNEEKNVKKIIKRLTALDNWKKYIKNEYSPLKLLFTGMEQHNNQCTLCNSINNNYQPFTTLQLVIPKNKQNLTIYNCLDNYTNSEILDESNKIKCDYCSIRNKAKKKSCIWKPPPILVIHLKRFSGAYYGKINNLVKFPLNLNIEKYIENDSPYKKNNNYNLFATVNHHGYNSNWGHYTANVKDRNSGIWKRFDDSNPIKILNNLNEIVNADPYLLFYLRTDQ